MRFNDARGRKVVSTATAETIGKIDGFVVDPAKRAVIAIDLKKTADGDCLHWGDLRAFGDDAVTVEDAAKLTEPSEAVVALHGKRHHLLGKRILSTAGDELGDVSDVEFDATSGAIQKLIMRSGDVDGSRLRGVGSWAVVVDAS